MVAIKQERQPGGADDVGHHHRRHQPVHRVQLPRADMIADETIAWHGVGLLYLTVQVAQNAPNPSPALTVKWIFTDKS